MSALKSVSWLWSGALLGAFAAFLVQVILARNLGSESFGIFAATLASVTIATPLAAFGVPAFLVRSFSTEGASALRWVKPALTFSAFSTFFALILVIAFAHFTTRPKTDVVLTYILTLIIPAQASVELAISAHQIGGRYRSIANLQATQHVLRALLLAGFLYVLVGHTTAAAELLNLGILYTIPSILFLCIAIRSIQAFSRRMQQNGHAAKYVTVSAHLPYATTLPTISNVCRLSAPFGLGNILYLVYFQSGVVILGMLAMHEGAANFSIAIAILSAIYLLPSVLFQRFAQQHYHAQAVYDPVKFKSTLVRHLKIAILGSIATALMLVILGPHIIPLVFGEKYAKVIEIVTILAFGIPPRIASLTLGSALQTRTYAFLKLKCMFAATTTAVALSVALIPEYGIYGAASTLTATEFFLFAAYGFFCWKLFYLQELKTTD